MNRPTDNECLLDDVLSEAAPADFREALLGETLRLAGRRRRWRQTRRAAALLAALGLLAGLVWQNRLPISATMPPVAKAGGRSYQLIRTEPLPVNAMVTTHPLAAGQLVASAVPVAVIETKTSRVGFRMIGDDELLTLITPRPAALVRLGPHSEQLVFANPDDEKGFPVN
jgi:hypothetical protein